MRLTPIRIWALAAAVSLPVLAQQPAPNPQPQTGSSAQTPSQPPAPGQTNPNQGTSPAQVPSTANSSDVPSPELRPVNAELVSKLDTSSAKAGDAIVVRTTAPATTSSGVAIPTGSKIVGHITDVAARGSGGDNSRVTIQFDQAQLKGGQNLPIRSVIQSVAPRGNASASGGAPSTPAAPNGAAAGSAANPSPGSPPAAPSPSAPPQAASAPPAGTVVARNGNVVIRTTAIPGVFLAASATGEPFSNAAGALIGAKQDIRLEDGTTMVVAVVPVSSPAGNMR